MKLCAARNVNNTLVLFQSKPILKDELMWDPELNRDRTVYKIDVVVNKED